MYPVHLSNEEVIKRVQNWQSAPNVKPLIHERDNYPFKPAERGNKVILVCEGCGITEEIPDEVLFSQNEIPPVNEWGDRFGQR